MFHLEFYNLGFHVTGNLSPSVCGSSLCLRVYACMHARENGC
uniref:Uncharacterized protein n=1 Tax=Rhizophora mucronata TaxID=61149 RepID=A0A2P2NNY8_RHIMU